jgi:hypothetical protein
MSIKVVGEYRRHLTVGVILEQRQYLRGNLLGMN